MNSKLTFLSLSIAFLFLQSCATVYVAPQFDTIKRKHKTVAILPFDVTISTKRLPKNVTTEQIKNDEEKTGYSAQGHAYTYLLRQLGRGGHSARRRSGSGWSWPRPAR